MLRRKKIGRNKKKQAVTLIELVLAILLLSAIIMAGFSIELALRRMSVKPREDSRLRDEIMPIMRKIGKDFEYDAIGAFNQPSVAGFSTGAGGCDGLMIHIGGGSWRGYCWDSSSKDFRFYPSTTDLVNFNTIGKNITGFDWAPGANLTHMSVWMQKTKDPNNPVADPFENPQVEMNSTFFARSVSAS